MSADELVVEVPPTVPPDAAARLAEATIEVLGRMPNASNATFLARLDGPDGLAIYKPVRGERPLWDFEPGLYRREVATYLLSEALGLGVVPPTVVRDDAPLGPGSLQWFVNADFSEHYFSIAEQTPAVEPQLRQIAVLDIVANNTDRKSGHCLLEVRPGDERGPRVWAIDNGLCFSATASLRTVIWDYAGEAVDPATLAALEPLVTEPDALTELLGELLDADEITAVGARAAGLVASGVFPSDESGRGFPWPLV